MSNKIITCVSALTDDNIENIYDNNAVCIDIEKGFIGVHTSEPNYEIDVSGIINCSNLIIRNIQIAPDNITQLENLTKDLLPSVTNTYNIGANNKNWANAYINDVNASNISVSGNIVPLFDGCGNLGSATNYWANAYIHDLSVTNISVSGNIIPLFDGYGNLGTTTKQWASAYVNNINVASIDISVNIGGAAFTNFTNKIDNSFNNVYTKLNIDESFNNVYVKSYIDDSFNNIYVKSYIDESFNNVYTKLNIDLSFANVYTKFYIDKSFNNVYTRSNIDLSFANVYTKFYIDKSFNNVYTRSNIDLSFNNVYTKSNIDLSFNNVYTKSNIDLSFNNVYNKKYIDNSFSNVYVKSYVDLSFANVYNKTYIDTPKDAYPIQDLYSNATRAINSFIARNITVEYHIWACACWSPELGIFVAVGYSLENVYHSSYRVMTSYDGINWSKRTLPNNDIQLTSVCWSPLRGIFVAVFKRHFYYSNHITHPNLYKVLTSRDGINWTAHGNGVVSHDWASICWSPLRERFVAVAVTALTTANNNNRVMYSSDGETWYSPNIGINTGLNNNQWSSVCWSQEVGRFVAVSYGGTFNRIMTSEDGITWTGRSNGVPTDLIPFSICWSPEVAKFVVVGGYSSTRIMNSSDGISWAGRNITPNDDWSCVTWSAPLRIFVASAGPGYSPNNMIYSFNGWDWFTIPNIAYGRWQSICWSTELGIFLLVGGQNEMVGTMTSSYIEPPTLFNNVYTKSYIDFSFNNVYTKPNIDSSFNNVYTKPNIDSSFANVYTKLNIDLSFNNVYNKKYIDNSFSNVYTKLNIDFSFNNVYTKSYIDNSFNNVYVKSYVDNSFNNVYNKKYIDNSFSNVYTRLNIDESFNNVYTKLNIDLSFNNVYTKLNIDNLFNNVYVKSYVDNSFNNVYNKKYIDNSFSNVYTKLNIDLSFNNVYTKLNIDLSFNNVYVKTYIDKSFNNVYTKSYIDLSFNNLYNKKYIDNSFNNVYNKTYIDGSFANVYRKFGQIDVSLNTIPTLLSQRSSIFLSIESDIIPSTDINYNLGSASNNWSNAYIRDLSVTNISASGNIVPFINLSGSLGTSGKQWANAYIRDLNVTNISVSGNIVPFYNLSGSLGSYEKQWANAYIRELSVSSIGVTNEICIGTNEKLAKLHIDYSSTNRVAYSGQTGAQPIGIFVQNITPLSNQHSNVLIMCPNVSNNIASIGLDINGVVGWTIYVKAGDTNKALYFKNSRDPLINMDTRTTKLCIADNGNVGIGTELLLGKLHIYETGLGTDATITSGTMILEHVTQGGTSSIVFKSNSPSTNIDYGALTYTSRSSANSNNGILRLKVPDQVIICINSIDTVTFSSASTKFSKSINMGNNDISYVNNITPIVGSSLGNANNKWRNAYIGDVSARNINGVVVPTFSNVTTNIIPSTTNSLTLGSSSNIWSNAYIRDISTTNISVPGNNNILYQLGLTQSYLNISKKWTGFYGVINITRYVDFNTSCSIDLYKVNLTTSTFLKSITATTSYTLNIYDRLERIANGTSNYGIDISVNCPTSSYRHDYRLTFSVTNYNRNISNPYTYANNSIITNTDTIINYNGIDNDGFSRVITLRSITPAQDNTYYYYLPINISVSVTRVQFTGNISIITDSRNTVLDYNVNTTDSVSTSQTLDRSAYYPIYNNNLGSIGGDYPIYIFGFSRSPYVSVALTNSNCFPRLNSANTFPIANITTSSFSYPGAIGGQSTFSNGIMLTVTPYTSNQNIQIILHNAAT